MPTSLPTDLSGASLDERRRWLLGVLEAAAQADYIGESVSQLDHALQAATLADQAGDPELTLAAQGTVLMKMFRGGDEAELVERARELFRDVKVVKPPSSRSESREAFLLGKLYR